MNKISYLERNLRKPLKIVWVWVWVWRGGKTVWVWVWVWKSISVSLRVKVWVLRDKISLKCEYRAVAQNSNSILFLSLSEEGNFRPKQISFLLKTHTPNCFWMWVRRGTFVLNKFLSCSKLTLQTDFVSFALAQNSNSKLISWSCRDLKQLS